MTEVEISLAGGCLCGAVRYRLSGHQGSVPLCHCEYCRRQSGAEAVAWLEVLLGDFEWTGAEPRHYRYASELAPEVRRAFCPECGSSLTWERVGADDLTVATGTLDDPTAVSPTSHCWAPRQLEWTRRDDGLPRYEKGPPMPGVEN